MEQILDQTSELGELILTSFPTRAISNALFRKLLQGLVIGLRVFYSRSDLS